MENRVIKFRAWHRDKMYNVDTLSINDVGVDGIGSFAHPERNHTINVNSCLSFNTSTVFMQYTGLKDKNGVDIYEGDILANNKKESGVVVWYNAGFSLQCKRRNGCTFYIPLDLGFLLNKHVLGNIHQNPDLLC